MSQIEISHPRSPRTKSLTYRITIREKHILIHSLKMKFLPAINGFLSLLWFPHLDLYIIHRMYYIPQQHLQVFKLSFRRLFLFRDSSAVGVKDIRSLLPFGADRCLLLSLPAPAATDQLLIALFSAQLRLLRPCISVWRRLRRRCWKSC